MSGLFDCGDCVRIDGCQGKCARTPAPPMSDVPDEFMKAANDAYWRDCQTTAGTIASIARALMAAAKEADEAATKRERERSAKIVREWEKTMSEGEFLNSAFRNVQAAILKGDA